MYIIGFLHSPLKYVKKRAQDYVGGITGSQKWPMSWKLKDYGCNWEAIVNNGTNSLACFTTVKPYCKKLFCLSILLYWEKLCTLNFTYKKLLQKYIWKGGFRNRENPRNLFTLFFFFWNPISTLYLDNDLKAYYSAGWLIWVQEKFLWEWRGRLFKNIQGGQSFDLKRNEEM